MERAVNDVRQFMIAGRQKIGSEPQVPEVPEDLQRILCREAEDMKGLVSFLKCRKGIVALRLRLIVEELAELVDGISENNLIAVADALADLCYVTIGAALAFGIDLGPVWNEIQLSNMKKFIHGQDGTLLPLKDETGKVIKPDDWKEPDIAGVLERQQDLFDQPTQLEKLQLENLNLRLQLDKLTILQTDVVSELTKAVAVASACRKLATIQGDGLIARDELIAALNHAD